MDSVICDKNMLFQYCFEAFTGSDTENKFRGGGGGNLEESGLVDEVISCCLTPASQPDTGLPENRFLFPARYANIHLAKANSFSVSAHFWRRRTPPLRCYRKQRQRSKKKKNPPTHNSPQNNYKKRNRLYATLPQFARRADAMCLRSPTCRCFGTYTAYTRSRGVPPQGGEKR